ncbi:hypothetical protein SERLA73DRAFT_190433 [Serpula lacrymans var. lacrymans S7.3]|uniref:Uncharacterized protein n=2 Tax=Serpula lacrymans var. lacrymans TaxID=341189 RepID=F8QFM5_SERL3|nr:uncharacterized protein SERLADRAFT_457804 [Serpula lacrymans var. lacrymans S7.9]EGN92859.1 hypothetical protein SERLA73DRAFT_190433 [Serpula lacrymans var. lacrymans S7.3]EGO29692.1 hypothetical protein SERLADRAFT_457804 [Serpula lacrymans var. lacrymans S7.9]
MTTLLTPRHPPMSPPLKRHRRSATSVLAGDFDMCPARDVLTSLLNGVGPYKAVEKEEDLRRTKKKEKRDRDKDKKRPKPVAKPVDKVSEAIANTAPVATAASKSTTPAIQTSSFWLARGANHRPTIHIATMQRSVSVTPPPMAMSPQSTPGPSDSSSTSRTSSKRPRTPDDDEDFDDHPHDGSTQPLPQPRQRKKRIAVKKGWKGWVEGSPPPSEKLINLDAVPVLQERRTRSGKSFDAIGVGKDGWV